jgi:predicted transcriptional regulator
MDLSSKGMTQDRIATELQVSQGTVADDVSDDNPPTQKRIIRTFGETYY